MSTIIMNRRNENKKPSQCGLMSWLVKSPKKEVIKVETKSSQGLKNSASTEHEESSPAKKIKIE